MRTPLTVALLGIALLATAAPAGAEQPLPDTPDPGVWTPNNGVSAITRIGDTVYLGGAFYYVGPATGGGIVFDPASGATDAKPQITGAVSEAVPDGAGGLYVAGNLLYVQGKQVLGGIAHLKADGSLDEGFVAPAVDADMFDVASVDAIALAGDRLYVGGHYNKIGGKSRMSLAALNAATGAVLDTTFNITDASDLPGDVFALEPGAGNTVYVGGDFDKAAGTARANLTRFNSNGTLFGDGLSAAQPDGTVHALHLAGSFLYVGGEFTKLGPSNGGKLRRYNASLGTSDSGWLPGPDNRVRDIDSGDGKIFFTGGFGQVAGIGRPGAAAVNTSNAALAAWNPGASGTVNAVGLTSVNAVEVIGSTAYVGGNFSFAGGELRDAFVALDLANGSANSVTPSVGGPVNALAELGGRVFVGGNFVSTGGARRRHLAALGPDGKLTDWNPGANQPVTELVKSPNGQALYAAGDFTVAGGQPRTGLAALSPTSNTALGFAPNPNKRVRSLLVSPDGATLWAGGDFEKIGQGTPSDIKYLAALDTGTGAARALDVKADDIVFDLAAPPSGAPVYAYGSFDHLGTQSPQPARPGIAAFDPATGEANGFAPQLAGGGAHTIAPTEDAVFLAGGFNAIDGTPRSRFAKLTPGGQLTDWDPHPGGGDGRAIVPTPSGNVLLAGAFTSIASADRRYAAETDAAGVPTAWSPRPSLGVTGLFLDGLSVWVLGGQGDGNLPGGALRRYTRAADPAGPGPGGGPGGGGQPQPLSCALKPKGSKVYGRVAVTAAATRKRAILQLTAGCDRAAAAQLKGKITVRPKARRGKPKPKARTFKLATVKRTLKAGRKATLTVKLPSRAMAALRTAASASGSFTLAATGDAGSTGAATARIKRVSYVRLRRKG